MSRLIQSLYNTLRTRTCLVGLVLFSIHLGLVVCFTYFGASHENTKTPSWGASDCPGLPNPSHSWHNFLDLNRWDSNHYWQIAVYGYVDTKHPGKASEHIKWYPGYPLLARMVCFITGWKVTFVFSLMSAVFTLAFWLLLWSRKFLSLLGYKTILFVSITIICWPGGFFWFAGMTESLVAFLLLLLLYLWFSDKKAWIFCLLAVCTGIKQFFLPLTIAYAILHYLEDHPHPIHIMWKILLGCSGYIGYGLYQWSNFGNFFLTSHASINDYNVGISLWSLVDLNHYARFIFEPVGFVAFASIYFLLIEALRIPGFWENWKKCVQTPSAIPTLSILWFLAFAFTTFHILMTAYHPQNPFASLIRYQTANIYIFLLAARYFQDISWWKIALALFPILYILLFWQYGFIILYWNGYWVS